MSCLIVLIIKQIVQNVVYWVPVNSALTLSQNKFPLRLHVGWLKMQRYQPQSSYQVFRYSLCPFYKNRNTIQLLRCLFKIICFISKIILHETGSKHTNIVIKFYPFPIGNCACATRNVSILKLSNCIKLHCIK